MSGLDKTTTNARYEIEFDTKTHLPRKIRVTLLTGRKGETEVNKKGQIVGGDHVAFHFEYTLEGYGEAEAVDVPRAASKLLAKR